VKSLTKYVLTLLLLMLLPCPSAAQKKEMSQARTILKSKKGADQAERLMTGLLKDSANRENKRIYAIWYESVLMQYQAVNEKLYMKQKQDTAQFFELTRRLFSVAEALDSLDMRPDKKGRVDPEYRADNAEQLMKFRPNLLNACIYFVRKSDFQRAYQFSEAYMDCTRQPLFTGYHLDSIDSRMPEAAYWATYSAYRMSDPVLTLRHRHLALRDTSKTEFTLQYMAEARRLLKDDSLYMETLRLGFSRNPTNTYFFPRLMDYYTAHGDNEAALDVVNRALEADGSSTLYLFAKSTVLFNMGRYDECIALSDSLISMNDSLPDPYYNAGTAYLNKALKLHPLRQKKQMRQVYQKARPYMERYRQLAPDQQRKWGPVLYRIYLNLNMGRQFDEIDQLLKTLR
jgi:tetratricopeptide (TPR) repeat protein